MADRLARLIPFQTPEAKRLALLFGVVYFAQGMWYLPRQTITIVLKDRGLAAGQVADFFLISTIPWLIKPVYGLISDFVPLFGYRRKSYFIATSALAALAGLILASSTLIKSGPIGTVSLSLPILGPTSLTIVTGVGLFTLMAVGLAFTDVLTDAMMVENGQPRGLTGAFQSVQWGAITLASILVGIAGGYLAGARNLNGAFALAACFPLVTFFMAAMFVRETRAAADRAALRETWTAIRGALSERDVWVVGGFILFWTFSPSFGPAFLFYQTDTLKFSQEFIGTLDSLYSAANVVGAVIYAPLSRRIRLKWLIVMSIGFAVTSTLAFLLYRGPVSAVIIQMIFGCVGMITLLSILDLAAKACPQRVEATFFALLMSIYNGGVQLSENVGARLYDRLGYTPLIFISAGMTALAWLLIPLVKIDRIEAKVLKAAPTSEGAQSVSAR
ncbi:MAG: MFS transporter [Candidatus Rokubacteria bacterium]|nr:MFS transporter [Candidatus Rokubacteria bacterium]